MPGASGWRPRCWSCVQTFVKVVNYQHIMPTRYTLDVDLKSVVTVDVVDNSTKRKEACKVWLSSACCASWYQRGHPCLGKHPVYRGAGDKEDLGG